MKALIKVIKAFCNLLVLLIFLGFSFWIGEIESSILRYMLFAVVGFFSPLTMILLVSPKSFEKQLTDSGIYIAGVVAIIIMAIVFLVLIKEPSNFRDHSLSSLLAIDLILSYFIALNHIRSDH